ncbi:MAG: hypothetical protein HQ521_16800 [Bacteroidetes bacterium]|nr:hypothetical protein [Bacteroidota bacterium]
MIKSYQFTHKKNQVNGNWNKVKLHFDRNPQVGKYFYGHLIVLIIIAQFCFLSQLKAQQFVTADQLVINPISNNFTNSGPASISNSQEELSMARKFWLTFGIGPGYAEMKADDESGRELNFSGASMIADLGLGVYLNNNQVLFADFFGHTLFSPKYIYGGNEISMPGDISVGWTGAGIGFGQYIEPQRFLIKGSVGIDMLSIDKDEETIGETESGIYGKLAIGKEWLISNKVALGISAHAHIGSMKDKEVNGYAAKWKAYGFGATINITWVPRGLKSL